MYSFISVYLSAGLLLISIGSIVSSVPLWVSLWFKSAYGWKNTLLIIPFFWTAYLDIIADQLFALPILSFSLSQAPLTWLIQYVDITGHSAIVFWLLLLNVALTFTIDTWNTQKNSPKAETGSSTQFLIKRFGIILLLLFLPPLLYFFYSFQTLPQDFKGELNVGLVQPGSISAEYTPEAAGGLVEKHVSLTASLINQHNVDLIVWSEGAIGFPFLEDTSAVKYIFQQVLKWETPLLTGTFERDYYASDESIPPLQKYLGRNYDLYNSAMMITPQLAWMHLEQNLPLHRVKMYNKKHLMPFTEYVPFSDRFPPLSKLSVYGSDFYHFSKGASPEYLAFAAKNERVHRVSPIICWDLLSTNSSSLATESNAQFIAALTNESALGDFFRVTAHQMESYTRLRSIESRRSIAKASMTGYTLFTNPFGEAFGKVSWWSEQTSVERIPLTDYKSVYAKFPAAYSTLNLLLLISGDYNSPITLDDVALNTPDNARLGFVASLDVSGETVSAEDGIMGNQPEHFSLMQNYPNTFNPTTTIDFALPEADRVTLEVYDVKGKLVKTMVNETRSSGHHQVRFDASNFASGTYMYRLSSSGGVQTRKLTLIK